MDPNLERHALDPELLDVGQVEQRVVGDDVPGGVGDLVAAEQEAQRDQQAASRDERDHVRHTGHQHPADLATEGLAA